MAPLRRRCCAAALAPSRPHAPRPQISNACAFRFCAHRDTGIVKTVKPAALPQVRFLLARKSRLGMVRRKDRRVGYSTSSMVAASCPLARPPRFSPRVPPSLPRRIQSERRRVCVGARHRCETCAARVAKKIHGGRGRSRVTLVACEQRALLGLPREQQGGTSQRSGARLPGSPSLPARLRQPRRMLAACGAAQ
eukprot:361326-Chlamydomonas_euryale.AAC.1